MDARARASSTCLLMLRMIPDRDVSFGSASSIVGAAAVLFWSLLGVPAAALVSDWSLLGVPAAALFLDWSLLGVPAATWLFLSFSGVRAEASLLDWSLLEVRAAALLLDWSLWEVRAAASLLDWSLLVVGAGLGGLLLRLAFCGGLASGVVLVVSLWLGTGAFFSFFSLSWALLTSEPCLPSASSLRNAQAISLCSGLNGIAFHCCLRFCSFRFLLALLSFSFLGHPWSWPAIWPGLCDPCPWHRPPLWPVWPVQLLAFCMPQPWPHFEGGPLQLNLVYQAMKVSKSPLPTQISRSLQRPSALGF